MKPVRPLETEYEMAILFRTVDSDVYKSTLETGSIWLRSAAYYRRLEDEIRRDRGEGVNGTSTILPLRFSPSNGADITIKGPGQIGQEIVHHYILSLHGAGISEDQRQKFGGCTMGVTNAFRLSSEVLYQASKQVDVYSYRFGPVSYRHTPLTRSKSAYGAAIGMGGEPKECLRSLDTDVLRKTPAEPFISQDEWRIALFCRECSQEDLDRPLKINVDPSLFQSYLS